MTGENTKVVFMRVPVTLAYVIRSSRVLYAHHFFD